MKTDDLIEELSQRLTPVKPGALSRSLLRASLGGLAASAIVMLVSMDIRPDLAEAVRGSSFWLKLLYTLALAGAGFLIAERLARPGANARSGVMLAAAVLCIIFLAALVELAAAPGETSRLVMGSSWWFCVPAILVISLPMFVAVFLAMRRFAPTNIAGAGAAAGLLAGAAGALVYGFHCYENAAPFVAVWYTIGMAIVAALGALVAKLGALRW